MKQIWTTIIKWPFLYLVAWYVILLSPIWLPIWLTIKMERWERKAGAEG